MTADATILDDVMAYDEIPGSEHRNDLRRAITPFRHSCRRFIVDEQGSRFVSNLLPRLDDFPEFHRALVEFAIPPFPQTYAEFCVPVAYENGTVEPSSLAVLTTTPIWYFLARIPAEEHAGSDARLMTVAWNTDTQNWQGARPWVDLTKTRAENADFEDSMGTMLNTARLLFLLMAQNVARYVSVPASRRVVRGKLKACAAKTEVHIDLARFDEVRLRFASSKFRAPVRHHEVRGHFVHYKTGLPCPLGSHDYQRVVNVQPDDARRRWCCRCGALRVWRTYPEGRGDATRGHVSQTYAVTHGVAA